MRMLFLSSCVLALGAAGCGKADCAAFAKAYCDRATSACGVSCSVDAVQSQCNTLWGSNCDMGPCIDAVKTASCTDATFSCSAKCPT